MTEDKDKNLQERGSDRRHSGDRRKLHVDPSDLPFPDRRKGDRRQMDRRVISEAEKQDLVEKVVVPNTPSGVHKSPAKPSA